MFTTLRVFGSGDTLVTTSVNVTAPAVVNEPVPVNSRDPDIVMS